METLQPQVPRVTDVVDPRIRRTRQMLHQALEQLLQSKPFDKISVGEIAEQATLNRATFYDHYPDKAALLEGMVGTRFQELLDRRAVLFDGRCPGTLTGIMLAMCDFLAALPGCREHRQLEKHFEAVLMTIVRRMILNGFQLHPPTSGLPPELLAATVSGAIYGGVSEWARTPERGPAEAAVKDIFTLVQPMLA